MKGITGGGVFRVLKYPKVKFTKNCHGFSENRLICISFQILFSRNRTFAATVRTRSLRSKYIENAFAAQCPTSKHSLQRSQTPS